MSYIINDESENKISSHLKLQSSICDFGIYVLTNFTNKNLLCLCKAYNVSISAKNDKKYISEKLKSAIDCHTMIPNPNELVSKSDIATEDSFQAGEDQPSTSHVSQEQPSTSQDKQSAKYVSSKSKATTLVKRRSKTKYSGKRKRVTASKDSEETVCPECNNKFDDNADWIQCNLCDIWYDRYCQNIGEDRFQNLGNDDWFCKKCCGD